MSKKKESRKLVMVEWVDCHTAGGSKWKDIEDIKETCQPLNIISVGFLIAKKNGMTQVLPHVYSNKQADDIRIQGQGEFVIPNSAIKKITILRPSGGGLVMAKKKEKPAKGKKKGAYGQK